MFVPDPGIGVLSALRVSEEGRVVRDASDWASVSVREGGTVLGLRRGAKEARPPLESSLVVAGASMGLLFGSRGAAPRGLGKKRPGTIGPPQIDLCITWSSDSGERLVCGG